MVDETEPEVESDLRRRAAWLLAMLAVVAVLLVVIMTTVIGSDNGSSKGGTNAGPLDGSALTSSAGQHSTSRAASSASSASSPASHRSTTGAGTSDRPGHASCPTEQRCVLDTDIGNAADAINAYRADHGKQPVPTSLSQAAKTCALHDGSDCTGGWAETWSSEADGTKMVKKIASLAHLLGSAKSFELGWAYDPGSKTYYFAIIRND